MPNDDSSQGNPPSFPSLHELSFLDLSDVVPTYVDSAPKSKPFNPFSSTAVIRTSDRIQFKSCRRRWAFQSHLGRNLEPKTQAAPLWFGSGIHFALEDTYNGDKRLFESPVDAFKAYVDATKAQGRQSLPQDHDELEEMGEAMLEYYYKHWLKGRDPLKTYIHNGVPQVEVNLTTEIPFDVKAHFPDSPYDRVIYSGTIDRVVEDDLGQLWLVDYKTAKAMKTTHFANDPQVTSYCWMASNYYDKPVAGMIYWQFLKAIPKVPQPLTSGKISVAKNQRTTHSLYRAALIKTHGSVEAAPRENIAFLNNLTINEGPDHDAFIRRDRIYKNPESMQSEGVKILMEMEDMLNPNLPLYPNPTFMCPHMCPFYEVCVSMDDGTDWADQLINETQTRAKMDESWRAFLRTPEQLAAAGDDINLNQKDFEA